ncbi:MAG: glycine C-acetyltransferase [Spirochaetales bacterium]|nr:glycine C-acetyltransferase [Spirochaetales bacterium]
MMESYYDYIQSKNDEIRENGLWKSEVSLAGPQSSEILVNGESWVNFCANNYLGFSNNEEIVQAATDSLSNYGFGMSSVRFICGTQDQHRFLEKEIAHFLGTEDSILYSSCFDANGGLFEALFSEEDGIISDSLNHASIIDGIRLSKAHRFRYENRNLVDLEIQLTKARASGLRYLVIATDGVFSMDGTVAPLKEICDLAEKFGALVMVDDSHAVGFYGPGGRGTPDRFGVQDRVALRTGTLGKALGGASGGYIAGKKVLIDHLRQRSRPYLFSNSLAPSIVGAGRKALELVQKAEEVRVRLEQSTQKIRKGLEELGYDVPKSDHPIIPVILGDARKATALSNYLVSQKILAVAFSFPVVPRGQARIRLQISASHTEAQLDYLLGAFDRGRGLLKELS